MLNSIFVYAGRLVIIIFLLLPQLSYSQYGTFWQESRNVKKYSFYNEYNSIVIEYNEGLEPGIAIEKLDSIALLAFEESDLMQYLFLKNEATNLFLHNSKFSEGYDFFQEAISLYTNDNDTINIEYVASMRLLRNLAKRLATEEHDTGEILQSQLEILRKIEEYGEPYRNTLVDYGLHLNRQGDKQKAIDILYEARKIALEANDLPSLAVADYTIISNLPQIYDLQKTTLEVLENDIKLFEESGKSVLTLNYSAYFNYMLGSRNYFDFDNIEKGILYTKKAMACLDTLPYPSWNLLASCNAELSLMYADKGDTASVWKHIEKTRDIVENHSMSVYNKNLALINIADAAVNYSADTSNVILDMFLKSEGEKYFQNKYVEVKAKGLLKDNKIDSAIYFIAEEFDNYKIIQEEKVPMVSDSLMLVDQLSFFSILEQAWLSSERIEDEYAREQVIIALIMEQNKLYRKIVEEDVYGFELSSLTMKYHDFIMSSLEYVLNLNNPATYESEILNLIFSSKSIQLTDYITKAKQQSESEYNSANFSELIDNSAKIQKVRNEMLSYNLNETYDKQLRTELNTLLVDNLILRYKNYKVNDGNKDVYEIPALAEIQKQLRDSVGIVEFCVEDDFFVYAFVTEDNVKYGIKYIDDFKALINKDLYSIKTGRNNFSLGKYLFEEIEDELTNIGHLVVIPDKELNMIPFEIFSINKQQPLIENISVSYSYSTVLWHMLNETDKLSESNSVLAFAPLFLDEKFNDNNFIAQYRGVEESLSPLKYSEEEVLMIEREFVNKGLKASVFKGEQANIDNLKNNNNDFDIVHFATHGISNNEHPERSGLFLKKNLNEDIESLFDDGFLSMGEIFKLDIDAELVVLSACNTGKGTIAEGEGVMALPRGFILAGVPNVIASLWKVNDEKTKEFMIIFYQYLLEGNSYANALRLAKLDSINKGYLPLDWAGFVLIGG